MKQANLIDRYILDGKIIIRAQHNRTGECFDIHVPENMTQHASCIWGGNPVEYIVRNGQAIFAGGENIPEDYEFQFWAKNTRKTALNATDDQLRDIYDTPMTYNQRQAAIRKIA